jgi:probable F420-dependent oxidoreductase
VRISTGIVSPTLQAAAERARRAEEAGYDAVLSMENQHEPFLPLAAAILTTERVELATAVAIAFARSPMAVANAAWDLHVSSGGRFILGLGSQVKGHNERRFSVPWSPPAPRLKEYVLALKAIWRCWEFDEPLRFEGKHYRFTLMPPNFMPGKSGLGLVPVTLAAVGPAMLRVSGETCDGVRLHPFCTREYLEKVVMDELETGFARGGRDREHFEISGGGFLATGPDDATVHERLEWVRQRVAFYGSTRTYFPVWEQHGLEDLGLKLHRMSVEGQWDAMAGEIPDDVLHMFVAVGRHDQIRAVIEERFGGLSDAVSESLPKGHEAGLPADLIAEIQKLPRRFKGYRP